MHDSEPLPPAPRRGRLEITLDDLPPLPNDRRETGPAAPAATPALPLLKTPTLPGEFCRACGSNIDPRAVMCPRCGVATRDAPAPAPAPAGFAVAALAMNRKSPGTAMLLSVLLTGAGQVYCGRVGRGIAFFCAAVFSGILVLALVGLILLPLVYIWALVDAYQLANKHNQALLATMTAA